MKEVQQFSLSYIIKFNSSHNPWEKTETTKNREAWTVLSKQSQGVKSTFLDFESSLEKFKFKSIFNLGYSYNYRKEV